MRRFTEEHRNGSGKWHRIGGPAFIYPNGSMFWLRHGKCHRRGGPAAVYPDGDKLWYVNGHDLCAAEQLPERAHSIMELFL